MRSWKKLSPLEGTASKFLFETIKSTQRIILAPKIVHSAEVNGDNELPDKTFYKLYFELHFTSHPLMPQISKCAEA